ncbi:MAG: tRNA (guanosine(37)-N1)-methyltransferase TrmD [Pseudomonadales bacterium]|jgi:tRNA (guanine37-N1)-methyltransferase|nr:tRNA (guanosine(37)-N1)-methyltransferase TrmD [Pseudomonadales bacterium]
MWIGVVSLFPEMFKAVTDYGISRRAVEKGLLTLEVWNPREFTEDKHRTVDDKPYGGGPGMLMKVQPLKDAINAAKSKAQAQCPVIYLSPQGKPLEQADLASLAMLPEVILVAGRYEGIDERLIESVIDMEVSIGDFVASGGELPAMLLIDGVTRLLPGAVGDADSVEQDSFSNGLLDYPQYTRPETEDGLTVPEVLMSGDHGQIARWRKMQSLGRTYKKRPDLITARTLTEEEKQLLDEYLAKRET